MVKSRRYEEHKERIEILERRILRRIYGPKKNNETGQYEIRSNTELRQL